TGQDTCEPPGDDTGASPDPDTGQPTGQDTCEPPGDDTGGASGEDTSGPSGLTDGFLGIGGDDGSPDTLGSSGDRGAETPKFTDNTKIEPVMGDNVQDFVANANGAMGQVGAIGHLATSWGWKPDVDGDDTVTKVNLWLETTLNAPRRGLGRG